MKKGAVLAYLLCVLLSVEARYRLEVLIEQYSNPSNRDFRGDCCDFGSCTDLCDIYFIICLRDFGFTPITANTPCGLGRTDTFAQPISTSFRNFGSLIGSTPNPLVFTGSSWPGRFQLAIRVRDEDIDSDDLVDRVTVNQVLAVSTSLTSSISSVGFYNRATMRFRFRVMCEDTYFGSDCTRRCIPQDSDTLGHFTCNSNGDRVCLPGYTGSDCLTVACADGCQGRCSGPLLCDICNAGFTGPLCSECQQLATGCDPTRATCDQPGQCNCNPGYSGTLCQIDDNVCEHQSPCQNGATCTNIGPDAHSCICPVDFTGLNCDVEINMCDSLPCSNGATCERTPGSFTCSCAPGWTGPLCDVNIDECNATPSPCQHDGTCTDCTPTVVSVGPVDSTQMVCPRGFTCNCREGFFGDLCETEVDYCTPSPCQNSGVCHDILGGPGYNCMCVPGFTGTDCEQDIDECAEGACLNGAECRNLEGSFTCSCPLGFNGTRCEVNIDDCASSPCNASNTQNCEDGRNAYTCVCHSGYTGANCEDVFDMCEAAPCRNNGDCMSLFNDFRCSCLPGFTGVECEININDCHPDLCLFGGTCVDQVEDYICECPIGKTGRQCETDFDPCFLNQCPSDTPVCVSGAGGMVECLPCVSTEAGCVNDENPLAQGSNNTQQQQNNTANVAGGVVGGVAAALLLLLLLLLICCCYCNKWCCCATTVQKEEVERDSTDHAQNNPLYFGVSQLVSSSGDTMPRYRPPAVVPSTETTLHNGYSPYKSLQTTEPHYEHIPAQFGNGGLHGDDARETVVASGSYSHLLDEPSSDGIQPNCNGVQPNCDGNQKSGKYDAPAQPDRPENPYVMGPVGGSDNPYEMGSEAKARRDMYSFLPTPEELKNL